DTKSKNQSVKNSSLNKCLKIVHETLLNYITLKKNIPSLLESTTCFQVSFRRDLPQIGKARFFSQLIPFCLCFACVLNNSTAVI
ncbi:hypothetical protein, partial [Escherichia coli]|uniref:hypothetical protein n=1 Tax=Escherichia coli TaxID=562 RepID=UPI0022B088E1